ncbi:MAG: chemotaxis protein [Xanthobacteraceae bacterium]|nr:chemotaxis protein [Xanthobacteraceae bacterium]
MNHLFGLVIEGLVAVLLIVTIGYCILLNKRLQRLKADEQSLKATIAELITATEIAERAIGGLKHAVRDVNEDLGSQLSAATEMSRTLTRQLSEGDDVLRRLAKIAAAARPAPPAPAPVAPVAVPEPPRMSAVRATVAAAQAFAERRRAAGLAA